MPHIHVTEPIHPDGMALLRGSGALVTTGWEDGAAVMAGADAWIVRTYPVDGAALALAPSVGIVSKHGVGVDNIDLGAARAAGVVVTNTPGANAGAVAEHALMLMLAAARHLLPHERAARSDFGLRERLMPMDLEGKRALMLGYGAIGKRLAKLCDALGMKVTVWHRRMDAAEAGFPVERDLIAAMGAADVVSIQLPLNEGTRGLIGAEALAALPDGAIVVNVGRGGVVDEAALVAEAPRLGNIGFDVFAQEPLPADDPMLSIPGAVLTPHSAGMSQDAMRAMGVGAAQAVLDHLAGRLDPARRVA